MHYINMKEFLYCFFLTGALHVFRIFTLLCCVLGLMEISVKLLDNVLAENCQYVFICLFVFTMRLKLWCFKKNQHFKPFQCKHIHIQLYGISNMAKRLKHRNTV